MGLLIGRWLVVPAADIIIHLVWFCVLVWTEEGCFMIKNYLLYILSIESRSYGVFPRRSHLKNRVFLIKTEQSTLEILQWTYHKYRKVFCIIKEYAWNKAEVSGTSFSWNKVVQKWYVVFLKLVLILRCRIFLRSISPNFSKRATLQSGKFACCQ